MNTSSPDLSSLFLSFLNKLPRGSMIFSPQGALLYANPAAENILPGLSKNDHGKTWWDIFPPETHQQLHPFFEQLQVKTASSLILDIPSSSGLIHTIELSAWVEGDASRQTSGILLSLNDVTAVHRIELALEESERKLSNLMANLPGMAYRCKNDPQWTMEFVSQGCKALTGYDPQELIQNKQAAYGDLIVEEDRKMVWTGVQSSLRLHQPFRLTYRIRKKDGAIRWVWEQGVGVYSPQGDVIALEGFIADINDQKISEIALQESHERLITILESINANIYVADLSTHEIIFVNQRMREERGGRLIGEICYRIFRGLEAPCSECPIHSLVDENNEPKGVVTWENFSPITHRWYQNHDRAIKWVDGRLVHLQISTDITELKQTQERLEYLSAHDALTGLYNRHYFEEELKRLQKSRLFPLSIIMIDVDDMKRVNDKYGHASGDLLLKNTADILRTVFRAEDVIARIGGDEFAVILPNADEAIAEDALSRITNLLSKKEEQKRPVKISLSCGTATARQSDQIQACLHLADQRMYAQKAKKTARPR
ncbi:MAG: diguanylate cyclase domain-containing protein [Chloroflexota bacterium]